MKKYQIIYADPPWEHDDKMLFHPISQHHHYSTMSIGEICALPIKDVADKNCILFLWAISPMLPEAIEVIKAWGFKYRTIGFCWNKTTIGGHWVSNMGRWTMGNIELCLIGVRGHPKRISQNVKQLVVANRTIHSRKPNQVRNRIVELMGDLPRIELFARDDGVKDMFNYNKLDGWDCWGNEVESDICL